jgi:glycosyltransferase involved in cell wall biosynthesis
VNRLWRLVDEGATGPWTDPQRYAREGGVFHRGRPVSHNLPPPSSFEDPEFFSRLIERITACEAPPEPAEDRVVLVNNGLCSGGAERQILATLRGLKDTGVQAIFIGERLLGVPGQDFYLEAAQAAGCDVRQLRRLTAPGLRLYEQVSAPLAEQLALLPPHFLLEILDMTRELRALRPKVLHLWQDETSIKHAISGLIAGVPRIVLSGRNVNPTHFSYFHPYMRPAYRALARAPGIIFSNNSAAGAASYANWLDLPKTLFHVIRNGFDPARLSPPSSERRAELRTSIRASLNVSPDTPIILGVFRLSHEKRPLLWIETAAALIASGSPARFMIAGEGAMRDEAAARISQLGLAGAVSLLGPRRNVADLYAAADALLLTSENEGLPNVLLEAQWAGLPVLTTDAGGSSEAVLAGVTGKVTSTSDPAMIAAELSDLLSDVAFRERAASEGPAFVEARFGRPRMIAETLALYALP